MRRTGTSVQTFFSRFCDEQSCIQYIFETRWGEHSLCPRCRKLGRWAPVKGRKKYVHTCRAHVSVLENTIFYRSNLSLMAWFYAMLLLCNSSIGVRASFIQRQLGLGTKSTSRMCNAIRIQMAAYERPEMLGGPGKTVYVDEALVKYGRTDTADDASNHIVMGFSCEGHVLCGIIGDRRASTFRAAITRRVRRGSRIVSDSHASYKQLASLGWDHVTVNHAIAFHDFAGNNLNEIETYWRVLKRTLAGYRMIKDENLWRYIAEVEFRYAHRRSPKSNFEHLLSRFPEITPSVLRQLEARFDWRKAE